MLRKITAVIAGLICCLAVLPGLAQLASGQSSGGQSGAENGCEYSQTFDQAREASEAIFSGTAVEEKRVPLATKGGTDISYRLVKFEVEKSWKMVDKKIVWVRVPVQDQARCGFDALNTRYLVYADRVNDELFISPSSRTMPLQIAANDLSLLGEPAMVVTGGEYRLFSIFMWGLAAVFAILLTVAFYIFRLSRRPLERM